jgi:hypothetical protein
MSIMDENIIPFGKYKGEPVEILAADKKYKEWLMRQTWFKEEHFLLYSIVLNNFRKAFDSPEFNRIKLLFENPVYRIKLAYLVNPELFQQNSAVINAAMLPILHTEEECGSYHFIRALANPVEEEEFGLYSRQMLKFSDPDFEQVDVSFSFWYGIQFYYDNDHYYGSWSRFRHEVCTEYHILIMPEISKDFQSALRLMKATMPVEKNEHLFEKFFILLIGVFTGTESSREEFVTLFEEQGYKVVFENEVDKVILPEFDNELKLDEKIEELILQNRS